MAGGLETWVVTAGWDNEPHRLNEQVTFTDGRIIVVGKKARRKEGKKWPERDLAHGLDDTRRGRDTR